AGVGLDATGLAEAVADTAPVELVLGLGALGLEAEGVRLDEAEHEALAVAVRAVALDQAVEAHVDLVGHRAAVAGAGVGLHVGHQASSSMTTPGADLSAPRRAPSRR